MSPCAWGALLGGLAAGGLGFAGGWWVAVNRLAWRDVTELERDEGRALEAWWRERHRRQALERGEDPDDGRTW